MAGVKYNDIDALNAMMPARKLRAVTPHDTNVLANGVSDALWINDEGVVDVSVVAEEDADPVVMTIAGPGVLNVRAKIVRATLTTATSIVALY